MPHGACRRIRRGPPDCALFQAAGETSRRICALPTMPPSSIHPPGCDIVLKTDGIIGGVHFFRRRSRPIRSARKRLRVNLSDLAAKARKAAGIPAHAGAAGGNRRTRGLRRSPAVSARMPMLFNCPLFGGDTDRTPGPITISVAAVRRGAAGQDAAPRRRQARRPPGCHRHHWRCALGLLAAPRSGMPPHGGGLRRAKQRARSSAISFRSRARRLPSASGDHASAAMDVSDGLAGDLAKLCRASGVQPTIEAARVPLSQLARAALARDAGAHRDHPYRRRRLRDPGQRAAGQS